MMISRAAHRLSRFTISHASSANVMRIDEETLLHYRASLFYPVHIGQTFHERYKVEVKVGFGGYSTVWLCTDQKDDSHKILKIGTCSNSEDREFKVLHHLETSQPLHDGRYCVRRACDSFKINASNGAHQCMVFEPLGMNLLEYVNSQPGTRISMNAAAWIAKYLLTGLDYLHRCHVVHTDVKLDNIMLTLPDDETRILQRFIAAERANPGPRKVIDDSRTIYTSRSLEYGNHLTYPIISDFGMAVVGSDNHEGIIQPVPYRAPEVILRMTWNSGVDIWNVGVLIWELMFSEHLFGSENEQDSLRTMVSYLGQPPVGFLARSSLCSKYFDDDGRWMAAEIVPTSLTDRLEGADIHTFLDFIGSMLRWVPEERESAAVLLKHPWLNPQ